MTRCCAPLSLTALRAALMPCQRRIRDDPPAPHIVDQIILADDPVTFAHQIDKKVEHLGFERHRLGPIAQLAPLDIEHVVAKPENHFRSLGSARMGRFLMKRQAHLKGKSSAPQSLPLKAQASSDRRNTARLRDQAGFDTIQFNSRGAVAPRPFLGKGA
jgi:hypothetical protein